MPIVPSFPRPRPLQRYRQVAPHVRIRTLLDRHRRRRVRYDNMQKTIPPTSLGGNLLQRLC